MRLCHTYGEFRRVLPAIRKEHQLAPRIFRRASLLASGRRDFAQKQESDSTCAVFWKPVRWVRIGAALP